MTDDEHDRWANGQIKAEFQKNAKDHLKEKFNKQDQDRIHHEHIERLKREHLIRQKDLSKHYEPTHTHPKPKKEFSYIQKATDKEIHLEREQRIKDRMKEIENEIKERQKEVEKSRDRQR